MTNKNNNTMVDTVIIGENRTDDRRATILTANVRVNYNYGCSNLVSNIENEEHVQHKTVEYLLTSGEKAEILRRLKSDDAYLFSKHLERGVIIEACEINGLIKVELSGVAAFNWKEHMQELSKKK